MRLKAIKSTKVQDATSLNFWERRQNANSSDHHLETLLGNTENQNSL